MAGASAALFHLRFVATHPVIAETDGQAVLDTALRAALAGLELGGRADLGLLGRVRSESMDPLDAE